MMSIGRASSSCKVIAVLLRIPAWLVFWLSRCRQARVCGRGERDAQAGASGIDANHDEPSEPLHGAMPGTACFWSLPSQFPGLSNTLLTCIQLSVRLPYRNRGSTPTVQECSSRHTGATPTAVMRERDHNQPLQIARSRPSPLQSAMPPEKQPASKSTTTKPLTPALSSKFRSVKSPLTPRVAGSPSLSPVLTATKQAFVKAKSPTKPEQTTTPLGGNITPRSAARKSRVGTESPLTPAQPRVPPASQRSRASSGNEGKKQGASAGRALGITKSTAGYEYADLGQSYCAGFRTCCDCPSKSLCREERGRR